MQDFQCFRDRKPCEYVCMLRLCVYVSICISVSIWKHVYVHACWLIRFIGSLCHSLNQCFSDWAKSKSVRNIVERFLVLFFLTTRSTLNTYLDTVILTVAVHHHQAHHQAAAVPRPPAPLPRPLQARHHPAAAPRHPALRHLRVLHHIHHRKSYRLLLTFPSNRYACMYSSMPAVHKHDRHWPLHTGVFHAWVQSWICTVGTKALRTRASEWVYDGQIFTFARICWIRGSWRSLHVWHTSKSMCMALSCEYMCMYVCMYVCMYKQVYVYGSVMWIHVYVCMYVCMYVRMYAHV